MVKAWLGVFFIVLIGVGGIEAGRLFSLGAVDAEQL